MKRGTTLILAVCVAVATLLTNTADACRRCRRGCSPSECQSTIVGYKTVERTVDVPKWTTVTRDVKCTEYKPKIVTRHRWVKKYKPYTKEVTRTWTEYVPVRKSREEDYIAHEPVWKEHTVKCIVYDRVHVKKKGTRKVRQRKVTKQKRTICRDMGCWQEQVICGPRCRTRVCRVWVPKIVKQEVTVDVCHYVWVDQPCEWTEVVCKPRTVERKVKRLHYKPVKKKRTIHWVVCKPKTHSKKVKVQCYKCVTVKEPFKCRIWEPVEVTRQVSHRVCKMVAKKVKCKMPIYGSADCGSTNGCDRRTRRCCN